MIKYVFWFFKAMQHLSWYSKPLLKYFTEILKINEEIEILTLKSHLELYLSLSFTEKTPICFAALVSQQTDFKCIHVMICLHMFSNEFY